MRHKIVLSVMTALIVCGLAGCGNTSGTDAESSTANEADEAKAEAVGETEKNMVPEESGNTEASDGMISVVYRSEVYDYIGRNDTLPAGLYVYGTKPGGVDIKYGLMNSNGEIVVDATYDNFYSTGNKNIVVSKDGKYGAIDETGNIVLDLAYDGMYSGNFENGLRNLYIKKEDETYENHIFDYTFTEVDELSNRWNSGAWQGCLAMGYAGGVAYVYNPETQEAEFENGSSSESAPTEDVNMYDGVVNGKLASFICPATYILDTGLIVAVTNGKYVDDITGPMLSDGQMVGIEGLLPSGPAWTSAFTYDPATEEHTSKGYLNLSSYEYIPLPEGFDSIYYIGSKDGRRSTVGGYGLISRGEGETEEFYIIDLENGGTIVNDTPYSDFHPDDCPGFIRELDEIYYSRYIVNTDGTNKYGYLDAKTMQPVCDAVYEEASAFSSTSRYAIVKEEGKLFLIDKDFNVVSEAFEGSTPVAVGNDYFVISTEDGKQLIMAY